MDELKTYAKKEEVQPIKNTIEYAHIPSDRKDLIQSALSLIGCLNWKYISPLFSENSLGKEPMELTLKERDAFEAALAFLENEFLKGSTQLQMVPTKITNS